jgi:hypothetical protein
MKSNRRAEIERMLATLESDDPLDVRTVAELFPDFEVRELSFPAASDLTGIPPRHAFCRVGQSDLVVVIRCLPSMEPDPETREAVEAELALLAPMEQPTEPRASKRRPPSEPAPIDSLDFRE